jgi:O-antigen/teichoic acid export membrane protein
MIKTYLMTLKYLSIVVFPLNLILIAAAPEFLFYILGRGTDKWLLAVVPLQILCVFGIMRAIVEPMGNIFLVRNKIKLLACTSLLPLIIAIVGISSFATFLGGIVGVALIITIAYSVNMILDFYFIRQILDMKMSSIISVLSPAVIASLSTFIVLQIIRWILVFSFFMFVVYVLIGGIIYLASLIAITKGKIIHDILELLKGVRK